MCWSRVVLLGLYVRLIAPIASRPIEASDPRIEAVSCLGPVGGSCSLRCLYRGPERVVYGQWMKELGRRTPSGTAVPKGTSDRRARRASLASFWNLQGHLESDPHIRLGLNRSVWGNATWTNDRFDLRLYVSELAPSDEGAYICAFYLVDLEIATARPRIVVSRPSLTGPRSTKAVGLPTRHYLAPPHEPSFDLFFLAPLVSIAFCLFARRYLLPRLTGMNGWVRMA